jgi:hypothetical protein
MAPKLRRELVALSLVFLLISPSFSFFEYPDTNSENGASSAAHGAKFDTKFSQAFR